MVDADEILADRLNVEPAVSKGCSSLELGVITGMSALVWLPASLLLAGMMGALTMGFGVAGIGMVGSTVILAGLFRRLKRGRPDAYYRQRSMTWLDDRGLHRSGFVRRSGAWDVGRTGRAPLPPRDR